MKTKAQFALLASILYFLLITIRARAQNPIIQYDSLYSTVLKEHRAIKLIFPKKYTPTLTDRFDVLYVLDGEWNTSLSEKVYEFLELAKFIPTNLMIVSIPNSYKNGINMRERDFTPTSTEKKDGKFREMKSSHMFGGASNFLQFLKKELVPFVNKKYPTKPENNILYGTSLGGLFAIYAYLQEPTLFRSYLTVEPSLWWDNGYVSKTAMKGLANNKTTTNTLWISSRDGQALSVMGIARFDSVLALKAPDKLQWKVASYSNETHFSAIWKGIYDGLKFTYVKSKTDGALVNRANTLEQFKSEN
jgi:predicted alpha/beta superfamily hydrolase